MKLTISKCKQNQLTSDCRLQLQQNEINEMVCNCRADTVSPLTFTGVVLATLLTFPCKVSLFLRNRNCAITLHTIYGIVNGIHIEPTIHQNVFQLLRITSVPPVFETDFILLGFLCRNNVTF